MMIKYKNNDTATGNENPSQITSQEMLASLYRCTSVSDVKSWLAKFNGLEDQAVKVEIQKAVKKESGLPLEIYCSSKIGEFGQYSNTLN